MPCTCRSDWSPQEEAKIKELENTAFDALEIEMLLVYSTLRAAAIRKMQCLKQKLKWLPTDHTCYYYTNLLEQKEQKDAPRKLVERRKLKVTRSRKPTTNLDNKSVLAKPNPKV